MSWTYNLATLTTDETYQVRYLVGDTDYDDQLVEDEEIDFQIAQEGEVYRAAAAVARGIAAKFARQVDKRVGSMSLSAQQRYEHYIALADSLTAQASSSAGAAAIVPYAGGISIADKDSVEQDTDRVVPLFRKERAGEETGTYFPQDYWP